MKIIFVHKQKGFTLIEVLVVIGVVTLLTAILVPILSKVRRQAKAMGCQFNLKQWCSIFLTYANYNNDDMVTLSWSWPDELRKYGDFNDLLCCPMATKPEDDGGRHPFAAFPTELTLDPNYTGDCASYGINGWVCNPPPKEITNAFGLPTANNWRSVDVKGASNIPLLLDSIWLDAYPDTTNEPPPFDGDLHGSGSMGSKQIRMFCINRHNRFINGIFLDFSTRKIGLKKLWKLKWHRKSDLNAPTPIWPDWMKKFKDY